MSPLSTVEQPPPAAGGVLGNFRYLMKVEVIPVISQGRGSEEVLKPSADTEIQGQHTGRAMLAAGGLTYRAVEQAQT